jgi:hypothetical protein
MFRGKCLIVGGEDWTPGAVSCCIESLEVKIVLVKLREPLVGLVSCVRMMIRNYYYVGSSSGVVQGRGRDSTNLVCRNDVVSSTDEGRAPVPKLLAAATTSARQRIVRAEMRELFIRSAKPLPASLDCVHR